MAEDEVGIRDLTDDEARRAHPLKWGAAPPDVLPAWVAEMDYATAPCVTEALQQAVAEGRFGYPAFGPGGDLGWAYAGFADRRYGWSVDPDDVLPVVDVTAGVRLAQDIARSKGMSDYVAAPYQPNRFLETDREIEDFIRETATTIFHPVGTCRMGHDRMAVVDPQLRVHGVSALRVVDASTMPAMLSGNTNAGSIAIGEYASDMIKSSRLVRNVDTAAR